MLICIAIAIALSAACLTIAVLATRKAGELSAQQEQVQRISREASGMLALAQDFMLHGSPRSAQQWRIRHHALTLVLKPPLPAQTDAAGTIGTLRDIAQRLPALLDELESAPAASHSRIALVRREMLADHLVGETQRITEIAYQLAENINEQQRANALRLELLLIALPLAFLLVVLGLGVLIARRILRPIRALHATAHAVASGRLEARCGYSAPDEFGDLARDFNAMTRRLESRRATLAENERKLRALTEHLPALVSYVNRDLQYQFCNAQYERTFGVLPGALLGKRFGSFISAAEFGRLQPHIETALRGASVQFETQINARDGVIDILGEFVPERDDSGQITGFYMMLLDVSERRKAQRQLAEAYAWQRAILASTQYAIIATDIDGVVRSVNPATARMLGYDKAELIGLRLPAHLHDPAEIAQRGIALSAEFGREISGFEVLAAHVRDGEAEEREWTYLHKDGTRIPVSLSVSAIRDADDAVTGFLGIASDITERKRSEAYIRHLAHHDVLTQLPNRALLNDRIQMALHRAERSAQRVAVIMLDLDNFKSINDSLGHHVGDCLLQAVAQRLLASVRPADTVARMGGDEFVILLDGINDGADIGRIADNILARIAEPVLLESHRMTVTTSLGVAVFPDHGMDADTLLKRADAAMYRAKASGRNACCMFTPEAAQD
ncbi:diguanylate cyclase domain-containing protein [Herminiimonas sp. CN]|uniref:diguanylate cyclase domain-containing protein n=1 Tax=Herminiimonas sp. CN TaxID=1349818 RepID=UPI00138DF3C0|nr:diguanylate cyclase [Herminiimonas sp. CN]